MTHSLSFARIYSTVYSGGDTRDLYNVIWYTMQLSATEGCVHISTSMYHIIHYFISRRPCIYVHQRCIVCIMCGIYNVMYHFDFFVARLLLTLAIVFIRNILFPIEYVKTFLFCKYLTREFKDFFRKMKIKVTIERTNKLLCIPNKVIELILQRGS